MALRKTDKTAKANALAEDATALFTDAHAQLLDAADLAEQARTEHRVLADHHGERAAAAEADRDRHLARAHKLASIFEN